MKIRRKGEPAALIKYRDFTDHEWNLVNAYGICDCGSPREARLTTSPAGQTLSLGCLWNGHGLENIDDVGPGLDPSSY